MIRVLLRCMLWVIVMAGPAAAQGPRPPGHVPPAPPPPPPATGSYDVGGAPSEDVASALAILGTAVPVTAGAVTWAVHGEPTATSYVLVYLGAVVGPSLGYHYAGLHRQAAQGESLRATLALATMLIGMDQGDDSSSDAVVVAGAGVITGLAMFDALRLRERMHSIDYGSRVEVRPEWFASTRSPGVVVATRF